MDRGAWQATVQGATKSQTQLSNIFFHFHTYLPGLLASLNETMDMKMLYKP